MHDLLTPEEDAQAAAAGWALEYVYDCATARWVVQLLPRSFCPATPHTEAIGLHVIGQARMGQPLSLKALRLIQRGYQTKGTK